MIRRLLFLALVILLTGVMVLFPLDEMALSKDCLFLNEISRVMIEPINQTRRSMKNDNIFKYTASDEVHLSVSQIKRWYKAVNNAKYTRRILKFLPVYKVSVYLNDGRVFVYLTDGEIFKKNNGSIYVASDHLRDILQPVPCQKLK